MRLRKLTAAALAVVAVTGLAACKSKAGAAALVDGHRISDSDVVKHVQPGAQPIRQNDGSTVSQKAVVLEALILSGLLPRAIEANGGPATAAERGAARDRFLQGTPEGDVTAYLVKNGFKASFERIYLASRVSYIVLGERVHATQSSDVVAALARLKATVSVSARYGVWDSRNLTLLSTPGAGVPSFVKLPGLTSASQTPPA